MNSTQKQFSLTGVSLNKANASQCYIGDRLPLFIGAVVFLSFLLLTMVFRSPLVALTGVSLNKANAYQLASALQETPPPYKTQRQERPERRRKASQVK